MSMFRNKRFSSRVFNRIPQYALSLVQAKGGTNAGGGLTAITTFTNNVTAGNSIIVGVQWRGTAGISLQSVSDTLGNTYLVNAASKVTAGAEIGCQMAYCLSSIAGGANIVTATFSSSTGSNLSNIVEITPGTFDQVSTGAGSGAALNAGTLDVGYGSFAVLVGNMDDGFGGGGGWTAGTGWTVFQNTGGGSWEWGAEYQAKSSGGSLVGDFTQSHTGTWTASMIVFKP